MTKKSLSFPRRRETIPNVATSDSAESAISLFRYGLDFLCNAIVRLAYKADRFQQALDILNGTQLSST